ncbi:MAG: carboxypeptidase-like regulatory domain-containing protein [Prevotella sp.]|nr:carboxypeptidase-like regulatory domain-containing protein [Prevotella sp.]
MRKIRCLLRQVAGSRIPTLLILLVLCLGVSAQRNAKVTMSFKNESMQSALKRLEKVSNMKILFTYEDVEGYRIDGDYKDTEVEGLLQMMLSGKPLDYSIEGNLVNITLRERLNDYEKARRGFSGHVIGDDGEPVIGATVRIMGTKHAVATDINGKFSFDVWPRGAQVVVSYIGMETATVKAAEDMRIVMKSDAKVISEVVVNGVFTRKANTFTGAVSTLKGDDLRSVGNQNILQSLKSLDPSFLQIENLGAGSNPNALPDFQMRGSSTVADVQGEYASSANQPLFILDGFESELTKIMDLDMNLVQSVTLLKDATAKAIYGAKAANGVIVIETRRPESGRIRVSYTGSLSLEAPDLSSYDMCSPSEKLEVERRAGLFTSKTGNIVEQLALDNTYSSKLAEIVAGAKTDWLAQPTRVGLGHKHSVYIEGGDQAMLYGVDLSYNRISGVLKGSDRTTFSGGGEPDIPLEVAAVPQQAHH